MFRQNGVPVGYFASARAQADYRWRFCEHCQHEGQCPVWALHGIWGDLQCCDREKADVLGMFIPRNGLSNKPCLMFVERREENDERQMDKT